jgi:Fe-S cluster assembly iron-binding protein IscA
MLMLTQTAVQALDSIVESAPVSEGAGVRISRQVSADGQPGLALSLVEEPDDTDQIVETPGDHVPVYVAEDAVSSLDDKILDAQVQQGQVGFVVADQGEGTPGA